MQSATFMVAPGWWWRKIFISFRFGISSAYWAPFSSILRYTSCVGRQVYIATMTECRVLARGIHKAHVDDDALDFSILDVLGWLWVNYSRAYGVHSQPHRSHCWDQKRKLITEMRFPFQFKARC